MPASRMFSSSGESLKVVVVVVTYASVEKSNVYKQPKVSETVKTECKEISVIECCFFFAFQTFNIQRFFRVPLQLLSTFQS